MSDESFHELSGEYENLDLQNIYSQLSIPDKTNFDTLNDLNFAKQCIEKCFDEEFLKIDTDILTNNQIRFNNEFIKLIKYGQANGFMKVHILFVAFCTYFNVDEILAFKILHEKIQKIIRIGYAKMIGKETYKRMTKIYSNKNNTNMSQMSLFDLVRKKQK